VAGTAFAACGTTAGVAQDGSSSSAGGDGPTIVVTTDIWADVVGNVACDDVEILTLIPGGADPHSFEPSLADAEALSDADLLVTNGLGLEAGLADVIDTAEAGGLPVFEMAEHVAAIETTEGRDPHIWFDPARVAAALPHLGERLVEAGDLDAEAIDRCQRAYTNELAALDAELADLAATVPTDDRRLVTNHDSLAYLAARYGFTVIGTVIPGATGLAQTNPAHLEDLAALVEEQQVPAIFTEAHHSAGDAEALARSAGDVDVVMLKTGSLDDTGSEAATYIGFLRGNMRKIVEALR
jgi:zinc/manganese transport system substrate-binding protein